MDGMGGVEEVGEDFAGQSLLTHGEGLFSPEC